MSIDNGRFCMNEKVDICPQLENDLTVFFVKPLIRISTKLIVQISARIIHKNSSFDYRFYLVKTVDGFTELLSLLDRPF